MRFLRVLVAWAAVVGAVGTVAVSAVLADGRVGTESTTNDGGAWLLNRSEDSIGHVNRVVGEVASVAGPFTGAFDVSQAPGVVVVTDRGAGQAVLIDTNLSAPGAPVAISADTVIEAVPGGVAAFERSSGRLWTFRRDDFGAVTALDDEAPTFQLAPDGIMSVGRDGRIAAVEADGSVVHVLAPDGTTSTTRVFESEAADTDGLAVVDAGDPVVAVTLVGEVVVILHGSGQMVVVDGDEVRQFRIGDVVNLQQPSIAGDNVVAVGADGVMHTVNLTTGEVHEVAGAASSTVVRPIVHDGCVWSITTDPVVFHYCGRSAPLGSAGSDLKLVLVNDWVWVNDVNLGGIWFVQEDDLEVREISDWTAALLLTDETDVVDDASGGEEEIVNNADADELLDDVDALDDDELNTPPVAEADLDATRQGRPVAVDVLANDYDDDNDPLSVDELLDVDADGFTGSGARVTISADGKLVQVVPNVDFVGDIHFRYVVHDGRQGRDEASVTVTVTPPDPTSNRAPVTVVDNATVRAGESVALNVLTNDSDPDGDVLALVGADDVGGAVNFTPDGELQFTPDISSPEGTVDIGYTVVDDFGLEAAGTARIRVRPADSNQPPQARNDLGRTSVGHSVTLNVLGNDTDPDGDPLIAQNLQSVDGTSTTAKLSPDGQFLFRPEQAGTYRFTYVVSDGPTVDEAQVRIVADPETDNRPPVAIVDEVALAIGESRLVRVLDNDGDPDGDVIGLVDWVGADGLDITEVPGTGFYVTATPSAATRTEFRYWISDGVAEPVMGSVVVSALARDAVDYPPVAVVDTIDARAGSTTSVYVLRNDYDPEGRPLEIVGPIAQPPEARVRVAPDRQSLLLTVADDQQFSFRFSYDVEDPAGNRGSAVVQVRIVPPTQPNRAPIAGPDVASTPHATPVVVPVILNDVDPDGDPIAIESIAEQPTHGSVDILPDGKIQYTPREGFSGTDRFVYTLVDGYQPPLDADGRPLVDGGPARDLGEVLIGVMPENSANRPPIAVDDDGFAPIGIATDPVDLDVLRNDSDPDSDVLVVVAVTTPAVGAADVSSSRRGVVYTPPDDGVPRVVSFAYTISDGRGGTATAEVVLDLAEAPDPIPPVAVDDQVGPATARSTVTIDPRLNDLDPDGDTDLLELVIDDPALAVTLDGQLEITVPTTSTEFEYQVRDEQGLLSEPAYIAVIVAPNQAPVITPVAVETEFETPITIDLAASITDPDQDPLVINIGAKRTGGSVRTLASAERDAFSVEFTPDTDFEGEASFDFVVDDRNGHTVTGTAIVTVLPPENREPTVTDTTVTVQAGIDEVVRLADLVTDPDGPDEHVFSIANRSGPVGVADPTAAGDVIVSSGVADGGNSAGFDYTLTDGPYSLTGHVTIDLVVADFPPPALGADTARTLQGQATDPIRVLDNDVDNSPQGLGGDGLAITAVGVAQGGTATLAGDAIVFTPDPQFFGTATFTYTVQDGRRAVQGESSATVSVSVIGRPATPMAPAVESVGDRYVVVGWNPPAGDAARAPVSGYILRYTSSTGTVGEIRFDQPTTTYRWDGLTNAVEYCFSVAAVNEAGEGDFSAPGGDPSCGSPDIRPESPAAPTVDFADSQLNITWQAPLNQGSPIRNYQLRISGGAQALSPELGVTTSYTWEGLSNGTDYTFEVRAQNAALDNDGWSDWSPLSSPEHPLTLPDAPAQPDAERGDRQVRITWQAPYDGGDAIQRYQVRSSLDSQWVDAPAQGQTNTYLWENIPNGTDVGFQVRAINRDPTSTTPGNVSPASPTVRTCAVPDAPAAPTAVRGDKQATVSWVAPNAQGCAISEYRITASDGAVQTAPAGATSHAFTSLVNGTAYTFTVTAINEVVTVDGGTANTSPASNAVTPAGAPFATNVTEAVNTGVRQVRVSWNAANPNGSPITGYEMSVNGGAWTPVGNVTTVTRNEASNGATYTYQVRAVNDVGAGAAVGGTQSATTWTYPGNPTVSASATEGRVNASWTAPTNGGTALTVHEAKLVSGSTGCGTGGTTRSNPGSPESWTGLGDGLRFRVCVRYSNAVGWGAWGSATARTPDPQPTVTAFWGASAQGQPGCSSANCKYLHGTGHNFTPGATVGVECWSHETGSWVRWSGPYNRTVASNGTVSFGNVCYFGWAGELARLRIGGVFSNSITN